MEVSRRIEAYIRQHGIAIEENQWGFVDMRVDQGCGDTFVQRLMVLSSARRKLFRCGRTQSKALRLFLTKIAFVNLHKEIPGMRVPNLFQIPGFKRRMATQSRTIYFRTAIMNFG